MHINVRQSSKSRILLSLIDDYTKTQEEEAILEASKYHSICQIEKRFKKSEVNQKYQFPRKDEQEEKNKSESPLFKSNSPKEISQHKDNFKELLTKIYISNLKNSSRKKTHLNPEFIKQQYSILNKTHRKSLQSTNKTQLQHSLTQNRLLTDVGQKQSYSRGQSPQHKQFYTVQQSIQTQLNKFMSSRQKEKRKPQQQQTIQSQNSCRSFELRYKFNKSPYTLMQNKSYDIIKQISQFQKIKSKNNFQ